MKSYLDGKDIVPMTKEQAKIFLECVMSELMIENELNESNHKQLGLTGEIFYQRLQFQKVKISLQATIFLVLMAEGNPGKIVMWAYTITRMFQKYKRYITLNELSDSFPMGFPSEEEQGEIWDDQKRKIAPYGNMIDDPNNWKEV